MTHGSMGDAIISWLGGIVEDRHDELFLKTHSATRPSWKRKRNTDQLTPTPTPSSSEAPPTMSASKRQRCDTTTTDPDATPRRASRPSPLTDASSMSSISQSDRDSSVLSTHPSRRTPIRQFQRMEVAVRDPSTLLEARRTDLRLDDVDDAAFAQTASVIALKTPISTHTSPIPPPRSVHRSIECSTFTLPPRNATTRCTRKRRGTCSSTSGS
ncbi:hypothetical protein B0T24DRAFT_422095 [Lasiosphaeria ovina]|uniref:Uncharacterized protein n=1 Tax=Lasiosphaeria ovina TaxID=92902 RepID=A0AAE0MZ96_9PEZI|nr:hypothetical protein B0T24DRAFT_422095 [Lasiosphaeria ovina]